MLWYFSQQIQKKKSFKLVSISKKIIYLKKKLTFQWKIVLAFVNSGFFFEQGKDVFYLLTTMLTTML